MKEEIAKNLLEKSRLHTSEDFTDRLLLKIEAEKAKQEVNIVMLQSLRYPVLALIGGGVAFFMVLFSGFLPKLALYDLNVQMNKTPFLVLLLFLLIMGTNHLLKLNSFVKGIRS